MLPELQLGSESQVSALKLKSHNVKKEATRAVPRREWHFARGSHSNARANRLAQQTRRYFDDAETRRDLASSRWAKVKAKDLLRLQL